jgi:5-methyltetrahydropteroyltriglutamate--homocysteine methyltransferase
MALAHILGYPRIGPRRELKTALEKHWSGEATAAELLAVAGRLRDDNWRKQRAAGLDFLVAGDHSLYDHVLDIALDLGVFPRAHNDDETLAGYFRLARGDSGSHALEMTKWFDTNYHYLVPELRADQVFCADPSRLVAEARRGAVIRAPVKVTIVGPLTFLWLSKCRGVAFNRLTLLPALVRAYGELFQALRREGVEWVQVDEPCLVVEPGEEWIAAYEAALSQWRAPAPQLLLTTYFEAVACEPRRVFAWPFAGIHLDLARAPSQLASWAGQLPGQWVLSAGIVDGRNVWRNDLSRSITVLEPIHRRLGDRLWIASSCSLMHVPVSLDAESTLDPAIRHRLAFADEKMAEVKAIATALSLGRSAVEEQFAESDRIVEARIRRQGSFTAGIAAAASRRRFRRAPRRAALCHRAAAPSHHDDRLLSADRGSTRGARRASARGDHAGEIRRANAGGNPPRHRGAGRDRPRRAGPWRAGTQRHGGILRRASRRVRRHGERLGTGTARVA